MLKYLQYGKLYFQWKLWYSNDKNNKHYVKVSTIFIHLLMLRKDVVYLAAVSWALQYRAAERES